MKMRRKNRNKEINLTPLLDVLFSILVIIMLGAYSNEEALKSDHEQQIQKLTRQAASLEEEKNTLQNDKMILENQLDSYDSFLESALILTISNIITEQRHELVLSCASFGDESPSAISKSQLKDRHLIMGTQSVEYIKANLEDTIREILSSTEKQPVYIVFHCDRTKIYSVEYDAVNEALQNLQRQKKEIFYKIESEETS